MKRFWKLCLSLLLTVMVIPVASSTVFADDSAYSNDLKNYLTAVNRADDVLVPQRDPETDQDFDEIADTVSALEIEDQKIYKTYIFDYKGIDRFENLTLFEVLISLNTDDEITNFNAFSSSTLDYGIEIVPGIYVEAKNEFQLPTYGDFDGGLAPSDFETYRVNLETKLRALSVQYQGPRMDVEFTESDLYLRDYRWMDGLKRTLNYEIEAEQPERFHDASVTNVTVGGKDYYQMKITQDMIPQVIVSNEDSYRFAKDDEKTVSVNIEYINDYFLYTLESPSFMIEVTLNDGRVFVADQDYETNLDQEGDAYKFFTDEGSDGDESIRGSIKEIVLNFEKNEDVTMLLTEHSDLVRAYKNSPIDDLSDYYEGNGSYSQSEGIMINSYYRYMKNGYWGIEQDENVIVPIYVPYLSQKVNVTFDSHGGTSVDPQRDIDLGSFATKPSNPTKDGFTFEGWYTDATFATAWNFDVDTVTQDMTLHANWEEIPVIEKYDVTFDSHGGSTVAPQLQLESGVKVQKPANPTKDGFTFEGWYTDATYATAWNFDVDTVTQDITLHAKWEEIPVIEKYDVTFDSHGGSTVAPQLQLESGVKVQKPANPTKDGFTFEGWYTDATYATAWNFDVDTVTQDITLHAKWEENPVVVEKYDVTFDSHGGSTVAPQLQLENGSHVMKPIEPTRVGYTFNGWYTSDALTTVWNFELDTVSKNMTLHAKWLENPVVVEKYDVTFDSHGGSTVAPQLQLESGVKVQKPANPTKDGFTFEGWYTDATYATAWNFDVDTIMKDMVLHAKWKENIKDEELPATGMKTSIIFPTMLVAGGLSLVVLKFKKD